MLKKLYASIKIMTVYGEIYLQIRIRIRENGRSLNLNPNSISLIKNAKIEEELVSAQKYDRFQFVRNGYFCVDSKDSKDGEPVFNRIVSLKSSFKLS